MALQGVLDGVEVVGVVEGLDLVAAAGAVVAAVMEDLDKEKTPVLRNQVVQEAPGLMGAVVGQANVALMVVVAVRRVMDVMENPQP